MNMLNDRHALRHYMTRFSSLASAGGGLPGPTPAGHYPTMKAHAHSVFGGKRLVAPPRVRFRRSPVSVIGWVTIDSDAPSADIMAVLWL